jgi:S-phase kinase-associated protein 1
MAEVLKMSEAIKDIVQNEAKCELPVKEANVRPDVLEKVNEWRNHHKDDARRRSKRPSGGKRSTDNNISEWDKEFFNGDPAILFSILIAANYLGIPALLDTACKAMDNMMADCTTATAVEEKLGIVNDFQEKGVKKE